MGVVAESIRRKLKDAFQPTTLTVRDESHFHAGHAGHHGGGESHFAVSLVAEAFAGKSRIERQRAVYSVLTAELNGGVHALRLDVKTPGESR